MRKLLVFSVIWLCLTLFVKADEVLIDGINYLIRGGVVGVIAGEEKYKGDIKIPETIVYEGVEYQVTRIEQSAFKDCTELTSLELPESINNAAGFYSGCTQLVSINLPKGLTEIPMAMFEGCVNLENCKLPDSIKIIAERAFYGCEKLKELKIPSGVETIGSYAFYKCESLQSMEIPDGVQLIGNSHFYLCTNLYSVILPKDLKAIGSHCFSSCRNLTTVVLPEALKVINEFAFIDCSSLTNIDIPLSVTTIKRSAFSNCGIRELTISGHITNWDFSEQAIFADCKMLESVTFGKTASIPSTAFSGCEKLSSVTFLSDDVRIGTKAFENCTNLKTISFSNVTDVGESAFAGTGITSIVFPNKEIRIGYKSFAQCKDLVSVVFDGPISIAQGGFYECPKLESVVFRKEARLVHRSFGGCTGLKSVIFGGRADIGDYTFAECKNLEDVYYFYENMTPVSEIAFTNAYVEYATLHVPESLVEQYSNDATWGRFGKIVPLTDEDIAAHVPSNVSTPFAVRSHNGTFVVDGASAGTPITVYTSTGVLAGFATAMEGSTSLYTKMQKGDVAIVKVGQKVKQIMVE